jgi:hypothetical protein
MENYLDLSPMLRALRERPAEFEMRKSDLHHVPSGHRFAFDAQGNVRIYARCACSELTAWPDQNAEMRTAIASWEETYWRPLVAMKAAERRVAEINRAFASHFQPRSRLRKWWDNVVSAFLGRDRPFSLDSIDPSLPEDSDLALHPAPQRAGREHAAAVVDKSE